MSSAGQPATLRSSSVSPTATKYSDTGFLCAGGLAGRPTPRKPFSRFERLPWLGGSE